MPRFYFHLRAANKSLMDCEGSVLPDADAARAEALATVRDFFQPATGVDPDWEGWSMEACDERGRRVFAMAFADAAKLEALDAPAAVAARATPSIVFLDFERARREFRSTERRTRDLVHRALMLAERNRYEAKGLYGLVKSAQSGRARANELLERSRRQSSLSYGWLTGTEAASAGA